jgi:PAS domain S-box-containing protein
MERETLNQRIEAAEQRLEALWQCVLASSEQQAPLTEALEEFSTALQEIRLAAQELNREKEGYERGQHHADELEKQVTRRTAALQASKARFQTVFEEAAIGIALLDMEGRLVKSNPALQEMLGYSDEELRGRLLTEFGHPDDAMAGKELYQELVTGKHCRFKVEKRYARKDGQVVWGHLTLSLIRRAEGEPRFAIAIVEDITEQKQTQDALIQAEKLAITGRMAASLAHEINNPLQSVIGCLGLAQESLAEGEDVSQYLQIALEELRRAAGIVAQLRDLHRRSEPEEREPADVNALLEQVLMLSEKQCQKRQVEVAWRPEADLPLFMLVPDRIQQVFLNLVLNAVDAMPEGGRLQVSTSQTGRPAGVHVTFSDSGMGIAPDALPHVFDPFYTTKTEGLGLGLYISQNIVEDHGGHIEVESQVGEGTTFTVWLPAEEGD